MPVSVTLELDTSAIPIMPSMAISGALDMELVFRIRTEGRDAEFRTTLRQAASGVTTFFKEMGKGKPIKRKKIKRMSMKQETRCAESVGGRRHAGSGAKIGYKGDGRVRGRFRIENKFTTAQSIRVSLKDLTKIRAECEGLEVPVFDVMFRDKQTMREVDNWVLLPKSYWEKTANAERQANDD